MATLAEQIRRIAPLSVPESEHLRALCSSWQVLADLSFSDLMLYVPVDGQDTFEICAQVRPLTSQTLFLEDMVGMRVGQGEQPAVERVFREGRIWSQKEPVLVNGVPIRMDAIPVRRDDGVLAVLTKEGSPATSRRPGRLERVYLQAAERVSQMISEGAFPFRQRELGDWPRVGEGLFVLDESGKVEWASPNALSSLHRLGVQHSALGQYLDDLGVGATPVRRALRSKAVIDGELVKGGTHVRLRVLPLTKRDQVAGALVLARDVSEVRQKEREISVKEATIREVHHRVKNNLQTIASLLRLQGRRVRSGEAKAALRESVLRIGSIALVHETLSEQSADVADFGDVARRIVHMVSDGLMSPEQRIAFKVTGNTGPLGADIATPLAVTVTELLQNAVEHAFPSGRGGTVGVELAHDGESIVAVVWDDGVGMKKEATSESRLGLQIVRSLIAELNGEFELLSDGGTRAEIRIPV
jgi:two-component sensor histidine kinase